MRPRRVLSCDSARCRSCCTAVVRRVSQEAVLNHNLNKNGISFVSLFSAVCDYNSARLFHCTRLDEGEYRMWQRCREMVDRLVYFFGLAESISEQKRRLFITMLAIGVALLVADILLAPLIDTDWVNSLANAVMAGLFLGALWLLWRRRQRQELVLFGVFVVTAIYLLLSLFYSVQHSPLLVQSQGLLSVISPWLLWVILLVMTCFLTFRALTALRLAMFVVILFLLMLVVLLFKTSPYPLAALHDLALLVIPIAFGIGLGFPLAKSQEYNAQTDFLTSLSNRSRGYNALVDEIERARRYGESFAIILFDIDYFKKINDSCGHPCGDAVLRELASFTNEHIRRTDLLCRWGGEEFLLLMTHCDLASARLKADHLRLQLKNRPFHTNINLTASFGITAYYPYDTPNTLLERVDNALYRAKRNGRNCVQVE